jgi:hypothetical protein
LTRPGAKAQTPFGSPDVFKEPEALTVSPDGVRVYIADTYNYRVAVWSQG